MKRCLKAIVVLTVICTFVFIVTGGIFANDTYAAGDEPIIIPIPIDPESVNPHLSVVSTGEMPAYNAGSSATLPLSIKNNSSYTAKNVKITIEPRIALIFLLYLISLIFQKQWTVYPEIQPKILYLSLI